MPKNMFNACFCSKENITGFRWYARGSPAQKRLIYTLERSDQHQGLFKLQFFDTRYMFSLFPVIIPAVAQKERLITCQNSWQKLHAEFFITSVEPSLVLAHALGPSSSSRLQCSGVGGRGSETTHTCRLTQTLHTPCLLLRKRIYFYLFHQADNRRHLPSLLSST